MEVMIILAVGSLVISCGLEWLRLTFSTAKPSPETSPETCRACRKALGPHDEVYRELRHGRGHLCANCTVRGYGKGIITLEQHASAPPVAPAPVQPRHDTFWADVVGIPFELWCSMGSCEGQIGYVFPPGLVAYLAARRDAGDFRTPVSLLKKARRVEPETPPEWKPLWSPVREEEALHCPSCGSSSSGGTIMRDAVSRRLVCWVCGGYFTSPEGYPMLEGPWRGREYEYAEKVLQAEVIRGQGAFRARCEWLQEHIRCGILDMGQWPDKAECPSCDEEMVCRSEDGQSTTVIKRMVPPNPGLAARR